MPSRRRSEVESDSRSRSRRRRPWVGRRQIDARAKESGRTLGRERYRVPTIGATVGLDIATAGSGTPLQGGSGWSISGALYVTNLRTRRQFNARTWTLARTCVRAWVIKYDERERRGGWRRKGVRAKRSRAERSGARSGALLGFLNVRRAAPPTRDCPRSSRCMRRRLRLHGQRCRTDRELSLSLPPRSLFLPFSGRSINTRANVDTSTRRIDLREARATRKFARIYPCLRITRVRSDIKSRSVPTCETMVGRKFSLYSRLESTTVRTLLES